MQKKKPNAGSLDGWVWREFKALPVVWFDKVDKILSLVESEGVWPDGIWDAYIAIIPKVDGDATPLGYRPFVCASHCVLVVGVSQVPASWRLV